MAITNLAIQRFFDLEIPIVDWSFNFDISHVVGTLMLLLILIIDTMH